MESNVRPANIGDFHAWVKEMYGQPEYEVAYREMSTKYETMQDIVKEGAGMLLTFLREIDEFVEKALASFSFADMDPIARPTSLAEVQPPLPFHVLVSRVMSGKVNPQAFHERLAVEIKYHLGRICDELRTSIRLRFAYIRNEKLEEFQGENIEHAEFEGLFDAADNEPALGIAVKGMDMKNLVLLGDSGSMEKDEIEGLADAMMVKWHVIIEIQYLLRQCCDDVIEHLEDLQDRSKNKDSVKVLLDSTKDRSNGAVHSIVQGMLEKHATGILSDKNFQLGLEGLRTLSLRRCAKSMLEKMHEMRKYRSETNETVSIWIEQLAILSTVRTLISLSPE
ncbi:hypothetical protein K402DRAFT_406309 [Aulographum hederae CBS 113979]|uniref:Uncharacterized protein n=1 Tax=Aulographum hederae CBS 113979 TaxID=1176131 RepID=A0A6G1GT02_9PEZI|nr:hypothetical protein K402DRAFT_406309 [Aulographum hederae CBS 113979]